MDYNSFPISRSVALVLLTHYVLLMMTLSQIPNLSVEVGIYKIRFLLLSSKTIRDLGWSHRVSSTKNFHELNGMSWKTRIDESS